MYTKRIAFDNKLPVCMAVSHIDEVPLHCHEDTIEIILVLRGAVNVKSSFEFFTLLEGDYVVVNREDAHKIWRHDTEDNLIAVFHLSLQPYRAAFPHIDYVIFTCESFDLARYKGQTGQLRRLLLELADSLRQRGEKAGRTAADLAARLVRTLVADYSLEQYYNRSARLNADKLATYYTVVKYMYEQYPSKTLLQDIAHQEFYSKSYISHLFKEVGAASFQDILGYIRVFRAERLLLETGCPIAEIAKQCGFSDSKYFNRTFQKWFQMKPAAYRQVYQTEIGRPVHAVPAAAGELTAAIGRLRDWEDDPAPAKISITPITLKNIGSKADLLHCLNRDIPLAATAADREPGGPAYAVIRFGAAGNPEHTQKLLEKTLCDLQSQAPGDLEYWFIR